MRSSSCILGLVILVHLSSANGQEKPAFKGDLSYRKIDSQQVGKAIEYSVLLPRAYDPKGKPLPLVLLLHGGGGSARGMARFAAVMDQLIDKGDIVPMVLITPSCERCLYVNRHDGKANWENFILDELIPELRKSLNVPKERGLAVFGPSMGGEGTLRLTFRHPELFVAGAAHAPGIEAGVTFKDIPREKLMPVRSMALREDIYGKPVDADGYWTKNNPAWLARENADKIKKSGLKLFMDVGTEDTAGCYPGTLFLHNLLKEIGIEHEYQEVKDGKHDNAFFGPALQRGARFISRALSEKPGNK